MSAFASKRLDVHGHAAIIEGSLLCGIADTIGPELVHRDRLGPAIIVKDGH